MATGSILLSPLAATFPDGSTDNAAPALARVQSSAASPKAHYPVLLFDATTDEMCYWTFRMPADYSSGPVLKVPYTMVSATTGSVRFEGRVMAVTPGDAQVVSAKALSSTNSAGSTVPATAGHLAEASITLANADSVAAGDRVTIMLRRDADGTTGTDDAAGDCRVEAPALTYTTA